MSVFEKSNTIKISYFWQYAMIRHAMHGLYDIHCNVWDQLYIEETTDIGVRKQDHRDEIGRY